ncbi:uncharacterized protein LOC129302128 [Prosopis cineraria]|uniref:uncharacterized protein LOC129302128 n=1 Tax=Prosopis cineraria TaxID=364024 RepID=UPI00240F8E0C|nr:uncharacterized protein LOC129302128 [Prosopis cineraria]
MGDPWPVVPYNDPYDLPISYDILDFQNDHNPLPAVPSNEQNSSSFAQQSDADFQSNDPNSGQVIQDTAMRDCPHEEGKFAAGPSEPRVESHPSQENMPSHNFPNVIPLTFWPPNPVAFHCSSCQVLREIIHTNGIKFSKLEIHGRLGVICHAILRQNINVGYSRDDRQIHMIDFCGRSMEDVKNFVRQYCAEKNATGYFTVQDPLSAYYEALCIGMDWNEDINDEFLGMWADNSGGASDEAEDMDKTRTSLSTQRERAGKMKLSDFSDVFHLPIEEAARQVNLCPTVVKKICRKEGLARWPHRKIKSIMRKINILRGSLNSAEAASRAQTEAEIERLHRELIHHCGGILPTSLDSLDFNA